ncbi:hypothetical protein L1887_39253 [Cichorium endivia]|nr:hypothetical protein L1887_39253 [Cichorium endivia]
MDDIDPCFGVYDNDYQYMGNFNCEYGKDNNNEAHETRVSDQESPVSQCTSSRNGGNTSLMRFGLRSMGETAVDESMDQSVRPEKRQLEDDVKTDLAKKKARVCGEVRRVDVKKLAEIVLVLATTGKLRAGRNPTPVEVKMMMHAREKLAEICKEFAPKDVFPEDAFGTIIEDLGLDRFREPKLGFPSPKMSISEKLQLTIQKMSKSEVFPLHSVTKPPATSHSVRVFPSSKPDHAPISSPGFQNHPTVSHASMVSNSRSLPYQLPTSEVIPVRSSVLTSKSNERSNVFSAKLTRDYRTPNTHKEICKIIEKLIQPHTTDHQKWTPPSRDYMNKPLTCQACKIIVDKVATTLVCDACEKGYHLKCLHFSPKSIVRDEWHEWHCVKCLSITNKKPLPPKYGPVLRNINTPNTKMSSSIITQDQETESIINLTHECTPKGNIVQEICNDVEWVGGVVNEIARPCAPETNETVSLEGYQYDTEVSLYA